jgi:hypothetical protein
VYTPDLRTPPTLGLQVGFDVQLPPVKIVDPLAKAEMELKVNTDVAVLALEFFVIWYFSGF